jgi:transcriptional regulator with XRE-family HTH domain
MDIGARIKERRTERGMTADQVGRMIGRDRQSVYLYEKGAQIPTPAVVARFVDADFLTRAEAIEFLLGPEHASEDDAA